MRNLLIILVTVLALTFITSTCSAQNGWHGHGNIVHRHYHTQYHYHYPITHWYSTGTNLHVGPVYMSGRNVRLGINASFFRYHSHGYYHYHRGW